jgi:hypothetical protein
VKGKRAVFHFSGKIEMRSPSCKESWAVDREACDPYRRTSNPNGKVVYVNANRNNKAGAEYVAPALCVYFGNNCCFAAVSKAGGFF